jgi:hypothetical protein
MEATAPPLSSCATSMTSMRYATAPPLMPQSPSVAPSSPQLLASAPPLSPAPSQTLAVPTQKSGSSAPERRYSNVSAQSDITKRDSVGTFREGKISSSSLGDTSPTPQAEGRIGDASPTPSRTPTPKTEMKLSPAASDKQQPNVGYI